MTVKYKYFYFSLSIPYHQCQNLYSQSVGTAILHADSGERVQVPTSRLRQCVGERGLHGRYKLTIDENNKFVRFEQVSST